jgi:hypothetical protein
MGSLVERTMKNTHPSRLILTVSISASLIMAPLTARAQDDRPSREVRTDLCCCDPPAPIAEPEDPLDESARAAMITGGTFLLVGYSLAATYGLTTSSITNRYLGFVPVAGPAAIAWNSRDNTPAVGALIFATWAQAVGVMVLAIGAAQRHLRPRDQRVSFGASPTPGGAGGSISVKF